MTARAAELVWSPLDLGRRFFLRALLPWVAPLIADRARRVLWLAVLLLAAAFATTLAVPVLMLTVGPLLLGVPHLVADVRYLVLRPGLHRRVDGWLVLPPLVAAVLGAPPAWVLVGLLPCALLAAGPWWRSSTVALVSVALIALAWRWPWQAQWALLHGHNVIALWLWWGWRSRPKSHRWVPVLALGGAATLLLGADAWVLSFWAPAGATQLADFAEQLSPGLDGPWPTRVLLSFCFLQAVHYALWLRLVPEDDRRRPAPRSFKASWDALRGDLGPVVLWGALALWAGLLCWGLVAPEAARVGYLNVAAWHAYLELFVAARWLSGGAHGVGAPA